MSYLPCPLCRKPTGCLIAPRGPSGRLMEGICHICWELAESVLRSEAADREHVRQCEESGRDPDLIVKSRLFFLASLKKNKVTRACAASIQELIERERRKEYCDRDF
jgi:hypothetical protein